MHLTLVLLYKTWWFEVISGVSLYSRENLGVAEGTIQWTAYEHLKSRLSRRRHNLRLEFDEPIEILAVGGKDFWQWVDNFIAAGSAKLLAAGLTYPHEVLSIMVRNRCLTISEFICNYNTGTTNTFTTIARKGWQTKIYRLDPMYQDHCSRGRFVSNVWWIDCASYACCSKCSCNVFRV